MLSKEIFNLKKNLDNLVYQQKKIQEIINILSKCLKVNKNIFVCGNGGSAAEAEHLSAEFLVRLKPKNNRRSLPIISLTQNSPVVTACGKDYGFNNTNEYYVDINKTLDITSKTEIKKITRKANSNNNYCYYWQC